MWKSTQAALRWAFALAALSISTHMYAANGTWSGDGLATPSIFPPTTSLLNSANWVGGVIPGTLPTDNATFPAGVTGTTMPSLQAGEISVLNGYIFSPVGPAYTFNFWTGSSLIFTDAAGGGGINVASSSTETFNVYESSIVFQGHSQIAGNADVVAINIQGNSDAFVTFQDTSSAGTASFIVSDGSSLNFKNSADPNMATITFQNNGILNFGETMGSIVFLGSISGEGVVNVNLNPSSTLSFGGTSGQNDGFSGPFNIIQGNVRDTNTDLFPSNADFIIGSNGMLSVDLSESIGSLSGDGVVAISASRVLTITNNNDTVFSGMITDAGGGSLTLDFNGVLTLSGDANSYTGSTTINGGTLRAGTVNAFAPGANVVMTGGVLDLNGYDNTIAALDSTSSDTFVVLGGGTLTVTDSDGAGHSFIGTIYGTGGLIKQGSDTFTIGDSAFYSGPTQVQRGTLAASGVDVLSPYSDVILGNGVVGATLLLNSFNNTIGSLAGNAASTVSLGSATLTLADNSTTDYEGAIIGTGGIVKQGNGIFTLTGTGLNTYSGPTIIQDGALTAGAASVFSPFSDVTLFPEAILDLESFNNTIGSLAGVGLVNLGSATLTLGDTLNTTFDGTIEGTGGITLQGTGNFTLAGTNTYSGTTTISSGTLTSLNGGLPVNTNIVDNSALVLFQNGYYSVLGGSITGTGSVTKTGNGTVVLTGTNSYTGGTTISAGTLKGNTSSLQGAITDNGSLVFDQHFDGTFAGQLFGTGNVYKDGKGTLNLTTNSPLFSGTTYVEDGDLALNAFLGGNVIVDACATLSGVGTIAGNATINPFGVISPGNNYSIGTLSVGGNYVHSDEALYLVEINAAGQSDLINVSGTATLYGGTVLVENPENGFDLNREYLILNADGGVSGTFNGAIGEGPLVSPLFSPILIYTPDQVFLDIQTNLVNVACTYNERQVAAQLDSILNPNPYIQQVINQVIFIPPQDICFALEEITGEQLANDLITAEILNRQFIRRLYDPIRDLVTTVPCECSCEECAFDIWFEGSGDYASASNRCRSHNGFRWRGYEVTGGLQSTRNAWTFGIAGSYEEDHIHYHLHGTGKAQSGFGGIYGLYRPESGYVLADIAYGYTNNRVKRDIHFGFLNFLAESRPKISQVTFYAEAGWDLPLCDMLVQPFIGIEADGFWRKHFREHGADGLDLIFFKKQHTDAFSRLGLHVTKNSVCWDLDISADVAWDCRLTSLNNHNRQRFAEFGSPFFIKGVPVQRNSIDGAVTITQRWGDNFSIYVEAIGQAWSHISNYNVLGGFELRW